MSDSRAADGRITSRGTLVCARHADCRASIARALAKVPRTRYEQGAAVKRTERDVPVVARTGNTPLSWQTGVRGGAVVGSEHSAATVNQPADYEVPQEK